MGALGATQALLEKCGGALVNFKQFPAQLCFMRLSRTAEGGFRKRNVEFLRDRAHRFREADVLKFLDEAEDVSLGAAPETIEELAGLVGVERRRFFAVKGGKPGVVSGSGFFLLFLVSHHTNQFRPSFELG